MRGSAATECNSRRYFAAAREGSDLEEDGAECRSGPDLPLALLHYSRPLAALLDRSRPGLMSVALFPLLRAQNDLQHHARLLQRRLEVPVMTSAAAVISTSFQ